MLRLLQAEELSVAELQEILGMGQSRISMQLAQLKQAGLIDVRRAGQKSLYRMADLKDGEAMLSELLREAGRKSPLHLKMTGAFDWCSENAKINCAGTSMSSPVDSGATTSQGGAGRDCRRCSSLMPPLVVADLGAGEGTLSLLLTQRAQRVIAVDHSPKMLEYVVDIARKNGVKNLECRLGDLEELPLADGEVDLALLHQSLHHALHPLKAIEEAWRILKPGGRVVVMDLLKHRFEEAREMYADVWLGFSQVELTDLLRNAGFQAVDVSVVHREDEAPHFETVLAVGEKSP